MAKVLVTGAAGFIGSFLSRALVNRGDEVVGIDNFDSYYPQKAKEFNLDLVRLAAGQDSVSFQESELSPVYVKLQEFSQFQPEVVGSFKFFELDIRSYDGLKQLFGSERFDQVVHLAAMAGVPRSLDNPRLYTEVNVDGTVNLLDLSVKYDIKKFVFASSSSVYGGREDVPFKESDDVSKPISPYAATKRMAELMCFTFHYLHKLPVIIARIFGPVYGPLQRPYGMAAQRFIRQVFHDKPMTVYGNGDMGRDSTYIDDEVDGIIRCLDSDIGFDIFNIGAGKPVTVLEVVDHVKGLFGKGGIVHVDQPLTEVPITFADISKAKQLLGYAPKVSFSDGLRRQFEVFQLMPDWYKSLEG